MRALHLVARAAAAARAETAARPRAGSLGRMSFDDLVLGNYKTVSARLGLTVEGGVSQGHLRIYGIVDGVPVQMWFGPHSTHSSAPLTMNAALDLHIATRSLFGKIAGLFHDGHDKIGDDHF